MMKVIFTCGGTGGHITPAVAIADTVRENDPHAEILFIGTLHGMENTLVPAAGYEIRGLDVSGLSRTLTPRNLTVLYKTHLAVREATKILRAFSPDVVIGTGGYACYPTLRAAIRAGIPTAVHESNAMAGLAVRLLAARLDRVWLNFAAAREKLPAAARVAVVGNPLPRGFGAPAAPLALPAGCRRLVVSFGGSLGAAALNRAALDLMAAEEGIPDVCHIHATGKKEFEKWRAEFAARGLDRTGRMRLEPFLSPMPRYLRAATLVVSRAGALTVSELAAARRAAVLVPSPNVTGDHQTKNAAAVAAAGGAILLSDAELPEKLVPTVTELLHDPARRAKMEAAIAAFAHPEANKRIYEDILQLAKKRR